MSDIETWAAVCFKSPPLIYEKEEVSAGVG